MNLNSGKNFETMRSKQVMTSGGVDLHSESFGDPGAAPILLIMGATASGRWWPDDFCRMLADAGHFVIRYDHRDTGQSHDDPPGEPGYSISDLAADAVAVLDAYDVQRAHLAGMSLGGWLAQMLALTRPDRIHSLTLVASEPLASPDPEIPPLDPAILEYHATAEGVDWSDRASVIAFQTGLWRLLTGPSRTFDERSTATIAGAEFDRTANPVSMFNHAMLGQDPAEMQPLLDRLGEIEIPALIVHGTHDKILPYAHAQRLSKLLPNARLLTLEGAGHELNRQDWPAIVDAIGQRTKEVRPTTP